MSFDKRERWKSWGVPMKSLFLYLRTLYSSFLALKLGLLSLQSKAISSSSLSLSQISSSVQRDTKPCKVSKLCRRHDECSYEDHTSKHHHVDQQSFLGFFFYKDTGRPEALLNVINLLNILLPNGIHCKTENN